VVSDDLVKKFADDGFDTTLGARPLRRLIQRLLEDPMAEEVLSGKFRAGDTVHAELADGKVEFSKGVELPDLPSVEPVSLSSSSN